MSKNRDIVHQPNQPKLSAKIFLGDLVLLLALKFKQKVAAEIYMHFIFSDRNILPCELKAFLFFFFHLFAWKYFNEKFHKLHRLESKMPKSEKTVSKQWSRNAFCVLFSWTREDFCAFAWLVLSAEFTAVQHVRLCSSSGAKSVQTAEICFRKTFRFHPAELNFGAKGIIAMWSMPTLNA